MNENENNITPNVETQNEMEALPTENVTHETQTTSVEQSKKKKKGKGFIVFLLIVAIIVGIVFGVKYFLNKSNDFEDPFPDIDYIGISDEDYLKKYDIDNSFTYNIENDYANGVITKDQYLLQLAYSIYEPNKMDDKYKSLTNDYANPRDLFNQFLDSGENEISEETLFYIFGKYAANYIRWDFGEEEADKTTSISSYVKKVDFVDSAIVAKLNKVKLSKNGNFLIYYTTEGESKVSEETVNSYAAFLEDLIKNYKKSYGLDFKFEPYNGSWDPGVMNGFTQLDRVANLLKNNDIDPKYLDTAMPVYLINLDDIGVPAFYTHAPRGNIYARAGAGYWAASWSEGADIVARNQATTMGTTYTFPYISINSAEEDIDNAKALAAHELFHHYQDYICGEGKYENCKSGLFTTETTANVASIHNSGINKVGTTIGQHAAYVARNKLYENSIDKVYSGYGAYQFGYNYTKMVPDGTNKTWESMKTTEPLKYLYDNSNGKYKDVLLTTAEKNLTLDYDKKMLLPYIIDYPWKPIYQTAHSDINVNQVEKINYSSMHYYYANPSELSNTKTFFKALKEKTSELTILFFINEDGAGYKKVYSQSLDKEFVINYSDWLDYDELAFAIVETSIDNNDAYYNIDTNPTLKYEATVTPESLGLKKPDSSKRRTHTIMCYQIEDDTMFKEVYQVLINLDKDEKINNMMLKGTLEIENYDPSNPAYKIATKTVSGLLSGIKLTYKSKLKNVQMYTTEKENKYSILFNVTKDYDTAFKGSFYVTPNGKQSIIEAVEAQGFICE